MMLGTIRRFAPLVLAVVSLGVGSSGQAEQREARLLRGPVTERPIVQAACDTVKWNHCLQQGRNACSQKSPADKKVCEGGVYSSCQDQVKGCD